MGYITNSSYCILCLSKKTFSWPTNIGDSYVLDQIMLACSYFVSLEMKSLRKNDFKNVCKYQLIQIFTYPNTIFTNAHIQLCQYYVTELTDTFKKQLIIPNVVSRFHAIVKYVWFYRILHSIQGFLTLERNPLPCAKAAQM